MLFTRHGINPGHDHAAIARSTATGQGALEGITDGEDDQHEEHQSQDEHVHQLALLLGDGNQVVLGIGGRGSGSLGVLLGSHPKSLQAQGLGQRRL